MFHFFSYHSNRLAKRESDSHCQRNIGDYQGYSELFAGSYSFRIYFPGGTVGYPAQPRLIRQSVSQSVSPSFSPSVRHRFVNEGMNIGIVCVCGVFGKLLAMLEEDKVKWRKVPPAHAHRVYSRAGKSTISYIHSYQVRNTL